MIASDETYIYGWKDLTKYVGASVPVIQSAKLRGFPQPIGKVQMKYGIKLIWDRVMIDEWLKGNQVKKEQVTPYEREIGL